MGPVPLQFRAISLALVGIAAITFMCRGIIHANSTTAALLLLLFLIWAGMRLSFLETILASVASTICLDWYFIPPIGRLTVADPQQWIALAVFIAASLLASRLSTRLREQRDELAIRQKEIEKLYAFSRSMLLSGGVEDTRRLVVNKCMEILGATEVALYEIGGGIYRSEASGSISDESLRHVALCGAVDSRAGEEIIILPVTLGNKVFGSVGLRGVCLSVAGLQSLANTVAVGLAQAQAQEADNRVTAVRKSEELKSVMIDALAHDLKTPLTTIEAASQMLRDSPGISPDQRHILIEVLREETGTLRRRLAEAFHLARIDANRLRLESRPVDAAQVIGDAVQSLGERANSHHIAFDIESGLPPVFADYDLIVQALKQLIDNAVKYSPAGSSILISAAKTGKIVSISVRDHGPGLTELEQSRVFDKFYRGRYDRSAVPGTGMGLSIAKEILEAHGGSIRVESMLGQGSLFTIVLRSVSSSTQLQSHAI